MSQDRIAEFAAQQDWIAPTERPAQAAISRVFDVFGDLREPVRNALHGTWLHEPLHVVLTDVPIGSWTATVVFDSLAALGAGKSMDAAADATNILGLLGAVGAAITGLNDWAEIKDEAPRRIGAIHGLLNVVALGLFGASWLERRSRNRTTGRALAAAGYVVISLSAHLGGNLIYEHGIGVQDNQPLR